MSIVVQSVQPIQSIQSVQSVQSVQPVQPIKKKREATSLLTSPLLGGGYLLSHFRSTIGVVRLNFSVRNGKRWNPHAMAALSLDLCSPDA